MYLAMIQQINVTKTKTGNTNTKQVEFKMKILQDKDEYLIMINNKIHEEGSKSLHTQHNSDKFPQS